MTLELNATAEEIMRAVEALQELGRATHVPDPTIFSLALALEECGSNIVNHALQRDARQKLRVTMENTGSDFWIELRDSGPEFDPTRAAEKSPASEEDPGGWGIQLVRRRMDEIHYTRQGGENILRLRKKLDPSTKQDTIHKHQEPQN